MVKLVLTNRKDGCPPDGYRFTDPDTGLTTKSTDERAWLKQIAQRRLDNGLPPIPEADIYDQFCKLLPPGWCKYENGEKPKWHVDTRLNVHDVLRGTKVLASFISDGMPLVSKELAASRASTCARCPFNIAISGCQPCIGLANLISTIAGNIKTPADPSLKSCAICHCSNRAQTRLPIELLAKGVDADMREKFASVDFCWKRQELESLDNVSLT
jgi:hypothetical protein